MTIGDIAETRKFRKEVMQIAGFHPCRYLTAGSRPREG
jgi:hypothetical protein